jgi:hypothetical protein
VQEHTAKGLCAQCREPAAPGHRVCPRHLERRRLAALCRRHGPDPHTWPAKATWKLTADQRQAVCNRYAAGESTFDLAAEYGIREPVVRALLRRRGVPMRPQNFHPKLTPARMTTVLGMVAAGFNLSAAQKSIGVGVTQFWEWRKRGAAEPSGIYHDFEMGLREALGGIDAASRAQRVYTLDEFYFDQIDTEEKAYWLGFLLADGWVSDDGRTLGLKLQRRDRGHLEKFLAALGSDVPIVDLPPGPDKVFTRDGQLHRVRSGPSSAVGLHSTHVVASLTALGFDADKSHTATSWAGPSALLPAYWRGVVDGDGSIGTVQSRWREILGHRRNWSISLSGTYAVTAAFSAFVSQHFGHAKEPRPSLGCFVVSWRGTRLVQKIAGLLYGAAATSLDRKQARAADCLKVPVKRDWSEIQPQALLRLREELGSWAAVAHHLGVGRSNLGGYRRRVGI